jgi:hypothetical protein
MCIKTSKQLSISGWNVNGIFKNSSGAKTCKLEDEYFKEKYMYMYINESFANVKKKQKNNYI